MITLAGALVVILFSFYISRRISVPINKLAAASRELAAGNLDAHVDINSRSNDELGELARAFNDMNAQVVAGKRSQQDFVANVSHELKTPLTAIQGFSQAIADGTASSDEEIDQVRELYGDDGLFPGTFGSFQRGWLSRCSANSLR